MTAPRSMTDELIFDLFAQGCRMPSGMYDHHCISAYENAQAYLLARGLLSIEQCVYEVAPAVRARRLSPQDDFDLGEWATTHTRPVHDGDDVTEVLVSIEDLHELVALLTAPKPAAGDGTPNPANEEVAAKFRAEMRATEDGAPEGTAESLATCARMLNTYAPDCFPANEKGQVHFVRVMMESTADEIEAFLARLRAERAGWVPVRERLPSEAGNYIAAMVNTLSQRAYRGELYFMLDPDLWSVPSRDYYVTHWMPLPPLPAEREGEG